MKILDSIQGPEDVKALPEEKLSELCSELREFLLNDVSQSGGHLSSNLGVVEISVAIHRVFNTAKDRLVFDVGHQSYVHKLLTGRREAFSTLRKFGGLSGFPKPSESIHDAFIAGHASNSISVALGMARARTLNNADYDVVVLIGDGAMTGGLSFEGLSDAGSSGEPLVVILNDNGMSISKNVGGFARYLANQRIKPSYYRLKNIYKKVLFFIPGGKYIYRFTRKIKEMIKKSILPCSMFEEMGFQYIGPVDGHDVKRLIYYLERARSLRLPVIIHAVTTKGKGYCYSEEQPEKYHGVDSFDIEVGIAQLTKESFSECFGNALTEIAAQDPRICAITAAMCPGTGLAGFAEKYPDRFFDVGIAEGHAVTLAGGMASQGLIPVFAVYSTFLQRAFDMLIHDVALMNLHVVIAVDRAGIVGQDGETHQGVFDVGFLSMIPKMKILCPASFAELKNMLRIAIYETEGPVAIRYPRGGQGEYSDSGTTGADILKYGSDITLVSYGPLINELIAASDILQTRGISAEIIKLGAIAPVEYRRILESVSKTKRLMVVEDCSAIGCVGEKISTVLLGHGIMPESIVLKNTGMEFIPHGRPAELLRLCGLDSSGIVEAAENIIAIRKTDGDGN